MHANDDRRADTESADYSRINTTTEATSPTAARPDVDVTLHAERRFLERVDNADLYPADRIRREFREAEPVTLNSPGVVDPTVRHPESGAIYVYDPAGPTIITVLHRRAAR